MANIEWQGVFPALTTKFTASGAIDWQAMARHLEFQLDGGVHGLIILGSLGENATLSMEEKVETVRFFAQADRRGRPLVACIAESSTRDAKQFVAAAQDAGLDAVTHLLRQAEMLRELGARNTKQIEPAMLARSAEQAGNTGSDDEKSSVEPDTAGDRD